MHTNFVRCLNGSRDSLPLQQYFIVRYLVVKQISVKAKFKCEVIASLNMMPALNIDMSFSHNIALRANDIEIRSTHILKYACLKKLKLFKI